VLLPSPYDRCRCAHVNSLSATVSQTVSDLLKLNVKKRSRFKKATLYEREVIKKQKSFIRRQKLPYSYNMW
jgi:hypothetical protein